MHVFCCVHINFIIVLSFSLLLLEHGALISTIVVVPLSLLFLSVKNAVVVPVMHAKCDGILLHSSFNCIVVGHKLCAILSIDIGHDIVSAIVCNTLLLLALLLSLLLLSSILRLLSLELIDDVDELLIEWNPHKVLS